MVVSRCLEIYKSTRGLDLRQLIVELDAKSSSLAVSNDLDLVTRPLTVGVGRILWRRTGYS